MSISENTLDDQVWYCEICQQVGSVAIPPHTDVHSAIGAVGRSHRAVSPTCPNGTTTLQVVNPSIITSRAALGAENTIPEWAREPIAQYMGLT